MLQMNLLAYNKHLKTFNVYCRVSRWGNFGIFLENLRYIGFGRVVVRIFTGLQLLIVMQTHEQRSKSLNKSSTDILK